jgi:anti-anti-sigma factor
MSDLYIEQVEDRYFLTGELDCDSSQELAEHFEELGPDPATLDLAGLTFVDSIGLRRLILLKHYKPQIALANATPGLRRLLEVTGLRELLLD